MLKCSTVVLISYIAKLKPRQLQTSKNHLKLMARVLKFDALSETMRLCTLNSHSNNRALNPSEKLTVIRQQRKPVARIGGRGMKPVGSVEATHACKMGSNWVLSSITLMKSINLLHLQSPFTVIDFNELKISATKSQADNLKNQIYAAHF